jgi:hypothetical protein
MPGGYIRILFIDATQNIYNIDLGSSMGHAGAT